MCKGVPDFEGWFGIYHTLGYSTHGDNEVLNTEGQHEPLGVNNGSQLHFQASWDNEKSTTGSFQVADEKMSHTLRKKKHQPNHNLKDVIADKPSVNNEND